MRHIVVSVAGLGWRDLERRGATGLAGLRFSAASSVFPAVTCSAQGALRTGLPASRHGMVCNGWWSRDLRRSFFWEQSSALVSGERVWAEARAAGRTVGMFFFQQSLGEDVDFIVSPAHIHRHGGGSVLYRYTVPPEADAALKASNGAFPLWRYWGPLAHPKAGDACLRDFFAAARLYDPDIAFLYLPTLDYDAQRFGPDDRRCDRAFAFLRRQLERLADFASRAGAQMHVCGEYAIAPVSAPPAFPNADLRRAGLFSVRDVGGRSYPDFHRSRAFAMCDHEVAHVFVRDPDDIDAARDALLSTGRYESVNARCDGGEWAHTTTAGELLAVAASGSWCAYPWWTRRGEAPDYATHIDIHNKPGFDPCELFFDRGPWLHPRTCQDHSRVGGTHGRRRDIAFASTSPAVASCSSYLDFAASLRRTLCD